MRLLIASDALLDFIGERASTQEAWNKINALELTGTAELWVAASAFREVREALSGVIDDHDVRQALRNAMAFLSVCSVDASDLRFALDTESVPFGEALAESCARKIQADFIVTNQGPLALPRAVRRVGAEELFEVLESEQGLVFDLIDL